MRCHPRFRSVRRSCFRSASCTRFSPTSWSPAAAAAGLQDVGENRVQEALLKQERLTDLNLGWHLIGTLQKNKARSAAGRFTLIHSVDRADLAAELDRRTALGTRQPVLVQV